ncbi:MAG: RNA methyltransferase [Anaerolineales bacterium]|nr:RNA methyltransferase [Anaerolineales bacterium]
MQNPKIKWVRSLQSSSRERKETAAFVVEGVRLAEEALLSGWEAQLVLHTPDLSLRGQAIVEGLSSQGAPVEQVAESVMLAASDTETPQGVLVVVSMRTAPLPDQLDFVFIPDSVRDPGNLGTMLRTAAAAGVRAVLLPPGGVDPFSPKVVRAGMGAHFHLPLYQLPWMEIASLVKPLRVFLADSGEGLPYTQADFRLPLALVIGGEAQGAGLQAQRMTSQRVHIPMPGGGESLNAAVAAAVLLFEIVRQRRNDPV